MSFIAGLGITKIIWGKQTCKMIIFLREPDLGRNKCPDNFSVRFCKLRVIRDKVRVFMHEYIGIGNHFNLIFSKYKPIFDK